MRFTHNSRLAPALRSGGGYVDFVEGRRDLAGFSLTLRSLMQTWRESAGLSQTALADELGVDQSVISRIEANRRELGVAELLMWAEATGTSAANAAAAVAEIWAEFAARPPSLWDRD